MDNLYHYHTNYLSYIFFFFFNDTATTEIYTLSLHDALPISQSQYSTAPPLKFQIINHSSPDLHTFSVGGPRSINHQPSTINRSEEHTSELQSQSNLVCRLLLEKKK